MGNMKQNTIDAITALIARRAPTLKHLQLSYFGGEPLLAMKAIQQISGKALEAASVHGFELAANITTNASLLMPDRLNELVDLRCTHYQVSLDGWGEIHDSTRRRRNGSGSFQQIWENLVAAKNTDLGFVITLRIHLRPGNEESVVELVKNINFYLDDDRFSIMFKKIGNWGGSDNDHPEVYGSKAASLETLMSHLNSLAKRRSSHSLDEAGGAGSTPIQSELPGVEERVPYVCYASMSNSLVIRANGRINKCTVALSNPKNDIGKINDDGTVSIDAVKLIPWLGGLATLDDDYLGCPASKVIYNNN
jgi:uncharacterized protein